MTRYISTRGSAPEQNFEEVVLTGLASDGGLYVPKSLPGFAPHELVAMAELSYVELAECIITPFVGDSLTTKELRIILQKSYSTFRHTALAPLVQLDHSVWVLELFHGPTLAFKDFALQFLGNVLDHFLSKRKQHVTIVGATSGDTGSAAIAGCRGRKNMDIFIFHPEGRVSDVQRRQMTTVADANVHNVALKGTFDDCQDTVKALFADGAFRDEQKLVAVNSINWARILAQVVYYFYAALALGAPTREVSFAVPTGNFGDIFAGYIARSMGLPIRELVIATNKNDILARCLNRGEYRMEGVVPTFSPSMDIQISSNFERLLFDVFDRDAGKIASLMDNFRKDKGFTLDALHVSRIRALFSAVSADDATTLATIEDVYKRTGYLADPHTAVGLHAAYERMHENTPMVVLSTAHPAKFPDAVKQASGVYPELPSHLSHIMKDKERYTTLPADDLSAVKDCIRKLKGK